ncbi:MAG: class I SAM-dependent DNA methyltransferase [Muribaculaceae bacterium]|nr:class I SAM-dependent DNA methyltransferase [Muribaculaceae bacterium]
MNKTEKQIAQAADQFAKRWEDKGYEKGESQLFWTELLTQVYGVENPSAFIRFEEQVKVDSTNFIDGHIPSTRVLIEQKSLGKDLRAAIKQSDGTKLNPFEQAKRYVANMPVSDHPRWIVTCNFSTFLIYDMEQPNGEPEEVLLKNLGKEYNRLMFLVDSNKEHISREMQVSMQAGEIVGHLYDALLTQYDDNSPEALRWLNILCVRIVFCLYAEDAKVFTRDQFHDYLVRYEAQDLRNALIRLFDVLNTPEEQRSRYLKDDLKAFPYTNGGLFAEPIEIPQFTDQLRQTLLQHASLDFDWSEISPTIFGAVFESTLNPETRRSGGMHYTSIQNIHKVIDPLFLNDLRHELDTILEEKIEKQRVKRLDAYREKLAGLTFLDPACGSGNFLTETYLSLRRLENEAIRERYHGQSFLGFEEFNPIKVSINQFYGIEINDFAVTVASTALWISEAQMMAETERIIRHDIDFLPLKTYTNIAEGNALRMDWETVVPKDKLNYIMGNPPFIGYSLQNKAQKEDILSVFVDAKGKPFKTAGKIDYVAGWYYKAAQLMQGTNIHTALVSTNSITQGEQVAAIWKPLRNLFNIKIDFAYRTFRWDSEASIKAHVHCVIVGFSCEDKKDKILYDNDTVIKTKNINGYLIDAPDIYIESRNKSLFDVPEMVYGNKPVDGGNLIIEAKDYEDFIKQEPNALPFIKQLLGAKEQMNNTKRYCLWLKDVSPYELRKMPSVLERVARCKELRLSSTDAGARKLADTPHLFRETNNPELAIVVPCHSSENRNYIPMSFIDDSIVVTNAVLFIPNASLYHFGVLESIVHMAWMRVVCGRLEMRYRYSKDVVYNNFPWPEVNEEQRERIAQTAQAILDARALYPDSSLADLYDELTMPPELRKAHRDNDHAVMAAYGFPATMTEPEIVAHLFTLYSKLTQ